MVGVPCIRLCVRGPAGTDATGEGAERDEPPLPNARHRQGLEEQEPGEPVGRSFFVRKIKTLLNTFDAWRRACAWTKVTIEASVTQGKPGLLLSVD